MSIEEREVHGITVKNIIVTIISTVSIVGSVLTTYFQLRGDIQDVRQTQESTNRVNELRLKMLESQVALMQQEIHELKEK